MGPGPGKPGLPGTPGNPRPAGPPGPLEPPGTPVPQGSIDHRDPQDLWILGPPETSGLQDLWEISSTV